MARASGMRRAAHAGQFGIDELDVEAGIVDHQRRIAEKFQEFLDHMGEQRLVGEKFALRPCTRWDSIGTSRSGLR